MLVVDRQSNSCHDVRPRICDGIRAGSELPLASGRPVRGGSPPPSGVGALPGTGRHPPRADRPVAEGDHATVMPAPTHGRRWPPRSCGQRTPWWPGASRFLASLTAGSTPVEPPVTAPVGPMAVREPGRGRDSRSELQSGKRQGTSTGPESAKCGRVGRRTTLSGRPFGGDRAGAPVPEAGAFGPGAPSAWKDL